MWRSGLPRILLGMSKVMKSEGHPPPSPQKSLPARAVPARVLTLGRAAWLAGRSKTTIRRAVQDGRLPATILPDGSYQVHSDDVRRLWPPAPPPPAPPPSAADLEGLIRDLAALQRDQIAIAEICVAQASEIESLRAELDAMRTEKRSLWTRFFRL